MPTLLCPLLLIILLALLTMTVGCASTGSTDAALLQDASRIESESPEQFNNLFVVDNVWFASQPSEGGLSWAREHGVKTVINIRPDSEWQPA